MSVRWRSSQSGWQRLFALCREQSMQRRREQQQLPHRQQRKLRARSAHRSQVALFGRDFSVHGLLYRARILSARTALSLPSQLGVVSASSTGSAFRAPVSVWYSQWERRSQCEMQRRHQIYDWKRREHVGQLQHRAQLAAIRSSVQQQRCQRPCLWCRESDRQSPLRYFIHLP